MQEKENLFKRIINEWNIKFPYDYLWRKKYNVPFNSEVHRNMDFFDIKYDILEDKYIRNLPKRLEKQKQLQNSEQLLKVREHHLSKEELEKEFDELDLSQFDDLKI